MAYILYQSPGRPPGLRVFEGKREVIVASISSVVIGASRDSTSSCANKGKGKLCSSDIIFSGVMHWG